MQEMKVQSLGQEDSPGEGNGHSLQFSHLGNPMDRGAWQATAKVQPLLIQSIRRGDGVGDLFIYLFIKDIKNNRMRIAQ